jgi:hypothetical protein
MGWNMQWYRITARFDTESFDAHLRIPVSTVEDWLRFPRILASAVHASIPVVTRVHPVMGTGAFRMKKPLLFALLFAVALSAPMDAHRHVPDEVYRAFASAWGKHDAEAMAALWVKDGELFYPFTLPSARLVSEQTQVRALLQEAHNGTMSESAYEPDYKSFRTRPLGDDFILVNFDASISGAAGTKEPLTHKVTAVLQRTSHAGNGGQTAEHRDLSIVSMQMLSLDPPAGLQPGPK